MYEIKRRKYDNKYCLYHKGVNAVIAVFTGGTMSEQNDVIEGLELRNSQNKEAVERSDNNDSPKLICRCGWDSSMLEEGQVCPECDSGKLTSGNV